MWAFIEGVSREGMVTTAQGWTGRGGGGAYEDFHPSTSHTQVALQFL